MVRAHGYAAAMTDVDLQASILHRVLDPLARCFTADVARKIAALRVDRDSQARLDELADKAAEGMLTPAEREEYEAFVEAIDLVGILQAEARSVVRASEAA